MELRHFKAYELVDRETYEREGDEGSLALIHPDLRDQADNVRDFLGVRITVNNWKIGGPFQWRGLRTPEKAEELGAPQSAHISDPTKKILCRAIDFDADGMTADQVRAKILADKDNPLLSKITRMEIGITWVHIDIIPLPPGIERIHLFGKKKA